MSGLFLSIDFEDFAHDLKRDLGLWETGPVRSDALWQSYEDIDAFLAANGARATFFCTGIVASQLPDLAARIVRDGHELACHYHFHDELRRDSAERVESNLMRAKDALETAGNAKVLGFRAPKFAIDKAGPDQYRTVERQFVYDSSLFVATPAEVAAFRQRMGLARLRILPIYSAPPLPGMPPLKLGGSYLKLFPGAIADRLLRGCEAAGMTPHIYLHPYEFATGGEYRLDAAERRPLGARAAAYWGLRQHQWHTVGNRTLPRKLGRIVAARPLLGRLYDNIDRLAA